MDNVSRIILRNIDRLPGREILLVDPAPDGLFRDIGRSGKNVTVSTNSHGVSSRLRTAGARVHFEPVPLGEAAYDCVVLSLPREKARLDMLIHAASERIGPGGRLWLAGPNRGGIRSAGKPLERRFIAVDKIDSARHCSLFEASETKEGEPFVLDDYETAFEIAHAGKTIQLRSLPGVFAHGRLDAGTSLLLKTLEDSPASGRVLDFASGCGVIGGAVISAAPASKVTLLDDSALAIEAGKRSLSANGFEAKWLPSNGLAELDGRYDWILSNPPFHRGVNNDLDVARSFFGKAGTFLSENGRIRVVFNRHLPYAAWLRESFNRVDTLSQTNAFTVIEASTPK